MPSNDPVADGVAPTAAAAIPSGAPVVDARHAARRLADPSQALLSALVTEHFVLQSVRGVTVSEASSRASLYMTTLSGALVAYGFLARSSSAGAFLGVVLPLVFVLGVFTYERLVQTALEDVAALAAVQRIRRWYGSLLPGAAEFFPVPAGGTAVNELLDIGTRASWRAVAFTISSAVAAVNCAVGGSGVALLVDRVGVSLAGAVGVGVAAGVVLGVLHGVYQTRVFRRVIGAYVRADRLDEAASLRRD